MIIPAELPCMDCGKEVEYNHMLKDKIWLEANPKDKGLLCVSCIQKRLGRLLEQSDFYWPDSFMKLQQKGIL